MRTSPRSHVGVNKLETANQEFYELNREAECKRAQLHREAKDNSSDQYQLYWNKESVVFGYCETDKEIDKEYH